MSKYQEALNKIIRSCCPYCYDDNGCKNCEIKQTCNATAKSWVDTLQELVDKETPMKPIRKGQLNWGHCPCCDISLYFDNQPRCQSCGQKLDWSDSNE